MTVKLLHQIGQRSNGSNFNTLEEIAACNEPMHFDGVYQSVWENRHALEELFRYQGKEFTLFVSGNYAGFSNAFDVGQPLSRFCTIQQVEQLSRMLAAPIGWHGKRHVSCPALIPQMVQEEIQPPSWWNSVEGTEMILAWPYGNYDIVSIEIAKRLGYKEAWSVTQGNDGDSFAKRRVHLNW